MKLYNFTNHDQSSYADFFSGHGFEEVTEPLHPEVRPGVSELQIKSQVHSIISGMLTGERINVLVQGMTNVCYYALELLKELAGKDNVHAYYVNTERIRDDNDRFVFKPVELVEYIL